MWEAYSDRVEAFGLDENWVDVSDEAKTIHQGELLADQLRERVKKEFVISVSR